jgi:hypothetical protein
MRRKHPLQKASVRVPYVCSMAFTGRDRLAWLPPDRVIPTEQIHVADVKSGAIIQ